MKLYKIAVTTGGVLRRTWAGSGAAAAAARKYYSATLGIKRDDITTDEVEVPTSRRGLIEFLNTEMLR